jgi:hypothetical protein
MQAIKYVEIVSQLSDLLRFQKLEEILGLLYGQQNKNLQPQEKEEFGKLIAQIIVGLNRIESDVQLKAVFDSLGFGKFFNIENLLTVQTYYRTQPDTVTVGNNEQVKKLYWTVLNFRQFSISTEQYLIKERQHEHENAETLQFIVMDDSSTVDLERLMKCLANIRDLINAIGAVQGVKFPDIKVVILDSGSDLLLGLQTAKEVASLAKQFLHEIWDKLRFRKNEQNDRNMESVLKNLSVIEKVSQMQESGLIDQESASRLKHEIEKSTLGIIQNGVMLKEIVEAKPSEQPNRPLLEEQRRLLLEAPKTNPE